MPKAVKCAVRASVGKERTVDKREYERAKPMIWAMFAAALAQRNSAGLAASKADELVAEFEERFPVKSDDAHSAE